MILVKIGKNNEVIYPEKTSSVLRSLSEGFKELVERSKPEDYSDELYKIIYSDFGSWIIKQYYKK